MDEKPGRPPEGAMDGIGGQEAEQAEVEPPEAAILTDEEHEHREGRGAKKAPGDRGTAETAARVRARRRVVGHRQAS